MRKRTPEERARQFHYYNAAEPPAIRYLGYTVYFVITLATFALLWNVVDHGVHNNNNPPEEQLVNENPFALPYDPGEDSMSDYDYQDRVASAEGTERHVWWWDNGVGDE